MQRPRLVDVAKAAGVSVGAASDALAGKNRITEETRARVREAAARLGYTPNPIARALTAGHLPLIGVVLGGLRRPSEFEAFRTFYSELIGVGTISATTRGYALVVLSGLDDPMLANLGFGGLVAIDTVEGDPQVARALELGIPVLTDRLLDHPRVKVQTEINYGSSVSPTMDHFWASGRRRPALLVPKVETNFPDELVGPYRDWCAAHGTEPLVGTVALDDQTGAGLAALLADEPDAIFVTTPLVPVLTQLRAFLDSRGQRLGEAIDVVILEADVGRLLTALGLKTIGPDLPQLIDTAIHALIDAIETPDLPTRRLITEFQLRS